MRKFPFQDCPECVRQFLGLIPEIGLAGVSLVFIQAAKRYDSSIDEAFYTFLETHHDHGHPISTLRHFAAERLAEAMPALLGASGFELEIYELRGDGRLVKHAPNCPHGESHSKPRKPAAKRGHAFVPLIAGDISLGTCGYGAPDGKPPCGLTREDKAHSYLCASCERRSWSPENVSNGTCGHCHAVNA